MTCDQIQELLSDLMDDELAEGVKAGVEAHLATCEACNSSYRALKRTVRFVRRQASVRITPVTPGGVYHEFTRATMDDTSGKTAEEVFREAMLNALLEQGGPS
jgi:anti-sigma factor RsiW